MQRLGHARRHRSNAAEAQDVTYRQLHDADQLGAHRADGTPLLGERDGLVAARTERGLACLSYSDHAGGVDAILDEISTRISPRVLEKPARLDEVARELDEYFEHRRTAFDLDIDWALASPFAEKVLRATAAIPFGEISTYAKVAALAGSPKASRAAGNALGANPLPIIVPCHRVLHATGGLGGYTGGLDRKRLLLGIEGQAELAV